MTVKPLLLFAGTSEGKACANALLEQGAVLDISVATEYGELILLQEDLKATLHRGRLDAEAMQTLMRSKEFGAVIDATHPFAVEVSRNIRSAALKCDVPYYRLLREMQKSYGSEVATIEQAAEQIETLPGRVLLTTGSKELAIFTRIRDYRQRLFPRILPSLESLQHCLSLGYPARHIIAMQGPFSQEFNEALLRQLEIAVMVSKNSGDLGGYPEKVRAAQSTGVHLISIAPPAEEGFSLSQLLEQLKKMQRSAEA